MSNKNKIVIKNIFHMLCYIYDSLNFNRDKELVQVESIEDSGDLLAHLFVMLVDRQLKRGLHHEYVSHTEALTQPLGSIDMQSSLIQYYSRKLVCHYDEFTPNVLFNQIIRYTLTELLKNKESIKQENIIKGLQRLRPYFHNIEPLREKSIPWHHLRYHRHNTHYQLTMDIARLIIEKFLPTEESGENHTQTWKKDKVMSSIFEAFVRNFYKKKYPNLHITKETRLRWHISDSDNYFPLTTMETDITITHESLCKQLIIDTKYYSKTMRKRTLKHNEHLFQMFAYVQTNQQHHPDHEVAGLLLYAKTDETQLPNFDKCFITNNKTNKISAKTLDLGQEWIEIEKQLDSYITESTLA